MTPPSSTQSTPALRNDVVTRSKRPVFLMLPLP